MVLLLRSRPGVQPFDPRSSAPNGANGAVLLLEQYGASVSITSSAPSAGDHERVFVISDRLNDHQRGALLDFVHAGGVAVVADPNSTLHGGPGLDGGAVAIDASTSVTTAGQLDAASESDVLAGHCTVDALQSLRGVFAPTGVLFPTAPDEPRCFTASRDDTNADGHAFVVVRPYGSGLVVGFGDNHVVTNEYLRFGDNAGLLTALLAPERGAKVRIMLGTEAPPSAQDIGSGNETLLDLVRPGIWMGLTQLALAFIVLGIARGVRPGRAVREPRPTPIAGNELVVATGNLMQRARHADHAGWLLRSDFLRQLCAHHRLAMEALDPVGVGRVAFVVAQRTGVQAATLTEVLLRDPHDAAGLVRLRHDIEHIRSLTITSAERTTERV
ncbi:MAG: hypothetical protein JWM34_4512 [Ilumatobacteraceae bacterium]|nr:hypothetical protein [Ilumatobacteraceae bacterium]